MKKTYFGGCDVGSTTGKAVIIDGKKTFHEGRAYADVLLQLIAIKKDAPKATGTLLFRLCVVVIQV